MIMEDIEEHVKREQWLAKDRFDFSLGKGCKVGINIFEQYKFRVAQFTQFEQLLTQLDNTTLCKAFDWFESERLRVLLKEHFHKTKEPRYVTEIIVYRYIDCLLLERENTTSSNDIPSVRSEIASYARSFPKIASEQLIAEFEKSGILLNSPKQN